MAVSVASVDGAPSRFPLVDAALREHIATSLGVREHAVEVRSNGVGDGFSCGPTAAIEVTTAPNETFPRYVHARIRGVEGGVVCGDIRVRAEVWVWVDVPVAAASAGAGDVLKLKVERRARHETQGIPVDPNDGPFVAVAPILVDTPVVVGRVKARPDWKAGASVSIRAGAGSLTIRVPGRLLADARVGDEVRVASPSTGTVVVGTLTEDGEVLVRGAK